MEYHVVHIGPRNRNGFWLVLRIRKAKGCVKASRKIVGKTKLKRNAIKSARVLATARKCSVRIHGLDGRIMEERSYHNETKRPG